MSTPCPDEIEANLERLLFVWGGKLSKETLHQIENLRKHIQKGCLSDIPVGCGTETNERLHRHLNRSLLCGVSKIGPELAVAVMTCALYVWNCKRKAKSSQNKRTTPEVPVEIVKESKPNSSQHHMKQSAEIKSAAHSLYREQIEAHCTLLGLGRSEDEDTRKLRELFVKEISENIDAYKDWMTTNSHLEEIDKFNQDGYFASEVGDLCVKATATFMRIPGVVVTALPTQPTVPFLPREFVTTTPIFIAYDHSEPGHYDATKGMCGN